MWTIFAALLLIAIALFVMASHLSDLERALRNSTNEIFQLRMAIKELLGK